MTKHDAPGYNSVPFPLRSVGYVDCAPWKKCEFNFSVGVLFSDRWVGDSIPFDSFNYLTDGM